MDRRAFILISAAFAATPAFAQAALSQGDASRGIKEALNLAAQYATDRLGRRDGFFGDNRVRIPLPRTLAQAQSALRPLRASGSLDDLQLRMNRGAEAAMPEARRLFVAAIRAITVRDAVSIVSDGDDAATRFLRRQTETQLTTSLRPPMRTALDGAGAFTALDGAARSVQRSGIRLGESNDMRTEVVNFAVGKALDGAFTYIAEEERRIRDDPARQTTNLLRRIFGS